MPNNFRLTGDYYVSKEGSDANDGLTPETPLLTIQAALNKVTTAVTRRIIIGSGVYKEAISKTISASWTIYLISDGYVVFEGVSALDEISLQVSVNLTGVNLYFYGIEIRKYNQIQISGTIGSGSFSFYFNKCTIQNNIFINTNAYNAFFYYFDSTVFVNSNLKFGILSGSILAALSYDKCIFINSSMDGSEILSNATQNYYNHTSTFKNSYVDANSLIRIRARTTWSTGALYDSNTLTSSVVNNNIQGKIVFPWSGSVSGINSFNIPISYAQSKIDYPTYNFGSMSVDPKFNDSQNLNLTLQSDSPHIKGASDYVSNIGGTEYAVYLKASDAELTTGATVSNLTLQANNSYVITSPNTTGSIVSDGKFIQWPLTKPLTRIEWVGSLDFNKSITAGTAGNQNVPDYETATSGAAASPDRLCLKMRYSTQQTKPTTSGQWDNGGYWTAGEYRLFEINQKPKVDPNGIGNGSSSYVEFSGLGDIVPSWIQVDIILINNYNP
jgi:hypothetical protein